MSFSSTDCHQLCRHRPELNVQGASQGPGGWFLGFKGAPGSFHGREFGKLFPASPLLPSQDPLVWAFRTLSLSPNPCGSHPQLVLWSWDSTISSLLLSSSCHHSSFHFSSTLQCMPPNWALTGPGPMPAGPRAFCKWCWSLDCQPPEGRAASGSSFLFLPPPKAAFSKYLLVDWHIFVLCQCD